MKVTRDCILRSARPDKSVALESLSHAHEKAQRAKKRLVIYRAHLISDAQQSSYRNTVLKKIRENEWTHVYGIHDYWHKVLSSKRKEGSTDHYRKCGISVHGMWFCFLFSECIF